MMNTLIRYRVPLLFIFTVLAGSVLTLRQYRVNEDRHVIKREDFILLHERGYAKKAEAYYQRLLRESDRLSDRALVDDLQRTALLIDPSVKQADNLIWKYHWAIRKKLQGRAQERLRELLVTEVESESP